MSELSAKTSHALGQLRTQRKNMLDAGIEQSVIDKLLSKQAEIHKMDLTELVKILDAKTAKGVNKDAESEETEKRFLVESQNLVVAMRNTTDNAITDSIASLGAIAKDYIIKCAIPSTHARKDWSRMVFLKVNPSGVMSLFFGGRIVILNCESNSVSVEPHHLNLTTYRVTTSQNWSPLPSRERHPISQGL